MEDVVQTLYLNGDTAALIGIVSRASEQAEDDRGAYRALTLLARLGDPQAAAFCHGDRERRPVSAA
jgi:hypothetical protein